MKHLLLFALLTVTAHAQLRSASYCGTFVSSDACIQKDQHRWRLVPLKQNLLKPMPWREFLSGEGAYPFWISQGVAFAASVADAEVTHEGLALCHSCVEGNEDLPLHPSRGRLYLYNLGIGFNAEFGLSMLFRKKRWPMAPYSPPITDAVIHARGAIAWEKYY